MNIGDGCLGVFSTIVRRGGVEMVEKLIGLIDEKAHIINCIHRQLQLKSLIFIFSNLYWTKEKSSQLFDSFFHFGRGSKRYF